MSGIEFREYPPKPVRLHPAILLWGLFGGIIAGGTLLFTVFAGVNGYVVGQPVEADLLTAIAWGAGVGLVVGIIALAARWIAWAFTRSDRFDVLAVPLGTIIASVIAAIVVLVPLGGTALWPAYAGIGAVATIVFTLVARAAQRGREPRD